MTNLSSSLLNYLDIQHGKAFQYFMRQMIQNLIFLFFFASWVWGMECVAWQSALAHHYSNNAHHPQHSPGEAMEQSYLEESIVDMLACQWERVCQGREDVSGRELATMDEIYLKRYIEEDKGKVREILEQVILED